MQGVRVSLSSGEFFFVDADLDEIARHVRLRYEDDGRAADGFVRIGCRWINADQIAQITVERDIPSIHTPERLEVPA